MQPTEIDSALKCQIRYLPAHTAHAFYTNRDQGTLQLLIELLVKASLFLDLFGIAFNLDHKHWFRMLALKQNIILDYLF